jgi:hypothetical protein
MAPLTVSSAVYAVAGSVSCPHTSHSAPGVLRAEPGPPPTTLFGIVSKHPFLSDAWVAEAEKIRGDLRGTGPAVSVTVRMNQVITDVPFGDGVIDAHLDTSSGQLDLGLGHLDAPDVTVTLDYATAKAVFVDGTPQAGMQAFMAGKVKVQGDMTKLIEAMQHQAAPSAPEAEAFSERIRAITEEVEGGRTPRPAPQPSTSAPCRLPRVAPTPAGPARPHR